MRQSRIGPEGRGRSAGAGVAEHRTSTGLTRLERATRVAAFFVALALGSVPVAAHAQQSTTARIAATRAAIDDAANKWFSAQQASSALDAQISSLEQQITSQRAHVVEKQHLATQRALLIYKGASTMSIDGVIGSDALDTARRAELVDQANAENQHAIDELNAATADLNARRADLVARRAAQAKAVAEVAQRRDQLDSELTALRAVDARNHRASVASHSTGRVHSSRRTASAVLQVSTTEPGGAVSSPPSTAAESQPAPANSGVSPHHNDPFLVCTRARESNGIYTAVSPAGYYGAYQFSPTTWDTTSAHAGRLDLMGVLPSRASPYDQDEMAWALYQWQGKGPWGGRC